MINRQIKASSQYRLPNCQNNAEKLGIGPGNEAIGRLYSICMSISIHESLVQVWHSIVQFLPDRTKIESSFSEFRAESESFWVLPNK